MRTIPAFLLLALLAAAPCRADDLRAAYDPAVRELDGLQFLEDEPIWLCAPAAGPTAPDAWARPAYRLVGRDAAGRAVRLAFDGPPRAGQDPLPRAFEFAQTFGVHDPTGRYPLLGANNAIPEGVWEARGLDGDTARVLARFRVLAPPASERSVRDALARAARLAAHDRGEDAAALYAAVYQRYPRTAYLSAVYWGQWQVRAHTRFAHDPERWMEEVFAHFHDTCFGVAALDRWVRDVGPQVARPELLHLVGIYPDTELARAAQRYL